MMSEKVEKIIPLMHHILYFLSHTQKREHCHFFVSTYLNENTLGVHQMID